MEKTIIIDADFVIKNGGLDENIEFEKIDNNILIAQELEIRTALGTDLYNKIIDDINNSILAGNYLTLVDTYVTPTLLHYSIYYSYNNIHFNITNKGVILKDGENQNPIDREDLVFLKNSVLDIAQYYKNILIDYLNNNTSLFPELSTNSGADIQPEQKAFISSIYTPKYRTGGCGGPSFVDRMGCL